MISTHTSPKIGHFSDAFSNKQVNMDNCEHYTFLVGSNTIQSVATIVYKDKLYYINQNEIDHFKEQNKDINKIELLWYVPGSVRLPTIEQNPVIVDGYEVHYLYRN